MELSNNSLTIYEIEETREKFLEALNEEQIILDFKSITKIDMCAIQLLISLKKSSHEQGKSFEIKNVNEEIMNSFEITGTAYILGV